MKKTVAQVNPGIFSGKRVLLRVDFNVPLDEACSITDDSRIRAALPTIKLLSGAGAKVILASHLGRPKGPTEKLSLKPVAKRLSELIGSQVVCLSDCIGEVVAKHVQSMNNGQICLLENVRFRTEEEKNDPEFAKQLAALADIYVNDAFGTAHRAHASTEGVAKHLQPALVGLLMEKELQALSQSLEHPARPFATVIGGAKVSSKIGVLENLVNKVDVLVVGGAMAFSFLKAQGKEVGRSLVEDDKLDFCQQLMERASAKGVKIILPVDVVCAPEMKPGFKTSLHSIDKIPVDMIGLDVGQETIDLIRNTLSQAKTILWNGPLGVFEMEGLEKGTFALIDLLMELTGKGTKTIIGGGDSVAALEAKTVSLDCFTHVSTGGGASLEFLEGKVLPGVACLDDQETKEQAMRL